MVVFLKRNGGFFGDNKYRRKSVLYLARCTRLSPNEANLTRWQLGSNPYCMFCAIFIETTSHIFFECPAFQHIWRAPPFNLGITPSFSNFSCGICFLQASLLTDLFALACNVCWRLWFNRNQLEHSVFDNVGEDVIYWVIVF